MKTLLFIFSLCLSFASQASSINRIELTMTPEQQALLSENKKNKAMNVGYKLYRNDHLVEHTNIKIKTRGQSSIKMSRKNFEINPHNANELAIGSLTGKRLVLSAGAFDPLLLNNQLVYGLYDIAGLPHLKLELAELFINGKSSGLYMVSLHPEEHLSKNLGANISFRRGYDDKIEFRDAKTGIKYLLIENSRRNLQKLIYGLKHKKGQDLYRHLKSHIDIDTYFGLVAANYLVRNGDYYDEIFFYSKADSINYYYVFPWDLDDSFADKMHFQKNPGSINNGQSKRSSQQMIYSFESRLDQAISSDDVLLDAYLNAVEKIVYTLSPKKIDILFEQVWQRTAPYLEKTEVQRAGLKDHQEIIYQPEKIQTDFNKKHEKIQIHLTEMRQEIALIRSESSSRAKKMSRLRRFIFNLQLDLAQMILGY